MRRNLWVVCLNRTETDADGNVISFRIAGRVVHSPGNAAQVDAAKASISQLYRGEIARGATFTIVPSFMNVDAIDDQRPLVASR